MIIYKNEVINLNNVLYIKERSLAINIYFVGGTNHWIFFDDETSKMAFLTSVKLKLK